MKKLYLLSLILTTAALFFGCKKDENESEPKPQIKLDSTEVKNLINSNFFFNDEYHKPKSGSTNCRCFNNPISIAVEKKIYEPIVIKVHDTVSYTYRYQITNCSIYPPHHKKSFPPPITPLSLNHLAFHAFHSKSNLW